MARAHGVPIMTIRSALGTFQSTFQQNPGRLNVHDANGFRVILDYAHNAAGLEALGRVITGLRPRYRKCIGVISIPGDRRDDDILEMGRLAAGMFDVLFFREDPGTRGRPRGQVLDRLEEGALSTGMAAANIHLIAGEAAATGAALAEAQTGDLLIVTPTEVEATWKQIVDFRPQAATPPHFAVAG